MTQLEFANALGITPGSVSRWERGIVEPVFTITQMRKLCEVTKKHFDDLPNGLGKDYKFDED